MTEPKPSLRLTPRAAASNFAKSTWLTALCAALALSAGLNFLGGAQDIVGGLQGISFIPLIFNLMYALGAVFLFARLTPLRGGMSREKCHKAGTAAFCFFIILSATVFFLILFYYSNYSLISTLTKEQIEEAGITQQDIDGMWALLPYLIFAVSSNLLKAVSVFLFSRSLKRLEGMCAGKNQGVGIFNACSIVAILAAGAELCMLILNTQLQRSVVNMLLSVLSNLPGVVMYVSAAVLTRQVYAGLKA
ncbi:MAG: hypothetical protein IJ174_07315 [Clostridia bacterium]|nr:hypothetical protein [Clostridia bacterium]